MTTDELARELIHTFAVRLEEEGLEPDGAETLAVLGAMVATWFALRGGGEELRTQIVDTILSACRIVEVRWGLRHA